MRFVYWPALSLRDEGDQNQRQPVHYAWDVMQTHQIVVWTIASRHLKNSIDHSFGHANKAIRQYLKSHQTHRGQMLYITTALHMQTWVGKSTLSIRTTKRPTQPPITAHNRLFLYFV